ncbi:hypothetical protein QBC35DRAFT_151968 [Podospora australis]|uniref:Uncharacterized protein n=1 Tax=Podospora australis TaxID=1536484 RepID=A0AAN7AJ74_9PEZI|nr:hypothetical protein QBC35DRAFT_151968 [Podospora australis]
MKLPSSSSSSSSSLRNCPMPKLNFPPPRASFTSPCSFASCRAPAPAKLGAQHWACARIQTTIFVFHSVLPSMGTFFIEKLVSICSPITGAYVDDISFSVPQCSTSQSSKQRGTLASLADPTSAIMSPPKNPAIFQQPFRPTGVHLHHDNLVSFFPQEAEESWVMTFPRVVWEIQGKRSHLVQTKNASSFSAPNCRDAINTTPVAGQEVDSLPLAPLSFSASHDICMWLS